MADLKMYDGEILAAVSLKVCLDDEDSAKVGALVRVVGAAKALLAAQGIDVYQQKWSQQEWVALEDAVDALDAALRKGTGGEEGNGC